MTAHSKATRNSQLPLVSETPLVPQPPALVLFGEDGGRPRAAWFDASDGDAATVAAATMRLRALPLTNEADRDLAGQLARGRVLPSGRALVPLTKRDLYTRLVALSGEEAGFSLAADRPVDLAHIAAESIATPPPLAGGSEAAKSNNAKASGAEPPTGKGETRTIAVRAAADVPIPSRLGAHLFVGQLRPQNRTEIGLGSVVLAHEGLDDGWWEAEVIGSNGSTFSLRWCDYPTQPTILRKADELALLPPGKP